VADWIGEIRFHPVTAAKIRTKHSLTEDDVRFAIAHGAHQSSAWEEHPAYGWRLAVRGYLGTALVLAYLRPIDREDGLWECLTAWRCEP
jgi:hypothetical protein